jgi:hypothetical protein
MMFHHVLFIKPRGTAALPKSGLRHNFRAIGDSALQRYPALTPSGNSAFQSLPWFLSLFSLVVQVARYNSRKLRSKNRFRALVRENGDLAVDLIEKLSGSIH